MKHENKPDSSQHIDIEVARSLDVLDQVIGEFDDGLLSGTDSETASWKTTRQEPTKGQFTINDKIDSIFDELTQEIYSEEKAQRKHKSNHKNEQVIANDIANRKTSDRPKPGTVFAAKQSFLNQAERGDRKTQVEVLPYNETNIKANVIKRDKFNVQSFVTRTSVSKVKNGSQITSDENRIENAVITELKEQVEGKQGKIIKVTNKGRSEGSKPARKEVLQDRPGDKSAQHAKESKKSHVITPGNQKVVKNGKLNDAKKEALTSGSRNESHTKNEKSIFNSRNQSRKENSPRSRSVDIQQQNLHRRQNESSPRAQWNGLCHDLKRGVNHRNHEYLGDLSENESLFEHDRDRRSRSRSKSRTRGETFEEFNYRRRSHLMESNRFSHDPFISKQFHSSKLVAQSHGYQNQRLSYDAALPAGRQSSMMDLRQLDDERKNKRYSMAVGPYDDLPPHLRNYLKDVGPAVGSRIPSYLDQQLRFEHQLNIEAQRELLRKRGFPATHPMVAGEISIHPELVGHLHFGLPNQTTLPLSQEDFLRFLPEMQRSGMHSAFPKSTSDLHKLNERPSKSKAKVRDDNDLNGWPSDNVMRRKETKERRSRSTGTNDIRQRPHSMFNVLQYRDRHNQNINDDIDLKVCHQKGDKKPWFMKESIDLHSLPHLSSRTDSGIGDEMWKTPKVSRGEKNRSSFGMILKDKFQKNPNMYFPDTKSSKKYTDIRISPITTTDDWSDTDTLVHNMSEGSFDKDSGLSGGHSSVSNSSNQSSHISFNSNEESVQTRRRSRSITTPIQPVNTTVLLTSNPSVILNKKTLRNYTPRESSNLLRQFEEERYHTRDTRTSKKTNGRSEPQHHHDSQFSLLTSKKSHKKGNSHKTQVINTNTCDSHASAWSFASSAASFDYHAGNSFENKTESKQKSRNGSSNRANPSKLPVVEEADYGILPNNEKGVRIPPEGAPSEPEKHNHKPHTKLPKSAGSGPIENLPKANEAGKKNHEVIKDIIESSENDGELLNLRKLLNEGRIAGLNEKPPSFKPPSPPPKLAKPNNKKQKAPSPKPVKQTKEEKKDQKNLIKSKEKRIAPKPPDEEFKPPPPSNEVKFLGGRRVHSVENIHSESNGHVSRDPRRDQPSDALKRSTSMHSPKEYVGKSKPVKDSVAQLIADSTEKKFKFNNLFKGIWKKKQYSFDM